MIRRAVCGGAIALAICAAACGSSDSLSGSIRIDGSRTMAPLTKAIARWFMAEHPGVRISVGTSGTAAGFQRLCSGETDVADAVEPMDRTAIAACARARVTWKQIAVANDAVVLLLSGAGAIRCLTTAQLRQIWHRNSAVTQWRQVRGIDPRDPTLLNTWGPGPETETFAFFTRAVNGRQETRDYNSALEKENDVLLGLTGTTGTLAYVDYPVYERHRAVLRALAVDSGAGCVAPSSRAIADGTFRPLDRRLFIYATAARSRPALAAFLHFYSETVPKEAEGAGFVSLTRAQSALSRKRLKMLVASAATG